MSDDDLRAVLERLSPRGRDALRRVLIRDQPDRDAIASELLHYGDEAGSDWADIIDALTMHPDARRRVVRLLGELRPAPDSTIPGLNLRLESAGDRRCRLDLDRCFWRSRTQSLKYLPLNLKNSRRWKSEDLTHLAQSSWMLFHIKDRLVWVLEVTAQSQAEHLAFPIR